MGRGDRRSKKGKIFKSSYGNSRPSPNKVKKEKLEKASKK